MAAVRDELAAVPAAGIGYGLLRYLRPGRAALAQLQPSGMSVNYLGRFSRPGTGETVLGAPLQVPSPLQSAAAPRRYLLDVVMTVVDSRLLLEWTHSPAHHSASLVGSLAATHGDALRELVDACLAGRPARPRVDLDPAQLAIVRKQLDAGR